VGVLAGGEFADKFGRPLWEGKREVRGKREGEKKPAGPGGHDCPLRVVFFAGEKGGKRPFLMGPSHEGMVSIKKRERKV